MAAIELAGLTKRFGSVTALSGVDLAVEEGEIFGFLGPNGAGKSTTIDVLLDFVRPDAGSVEVFGLDAQAESAAVRQRTGVLPEGFGLYERLTAREHLAFAGESKGVAVEPDAILERVGLREAAERPAGGFSKGMGQRLALGMALVGDPDLLLLDEPTTGLDPNGARQLRELVRTERDRGATVFFSSHVLGQVEAVCDRVAILVEGEVRAVDSVEGLMDTVDTQSTLEVTVESAPDAALSAARSVDGVSTVARPGGGPRGAGEVSITCTNSAKLPALNALADNGAAIANFVTDSATLEDLFVAVTDEASDDDATSGDPPSTAAAEAGDDVANAPGADGSDEVGP
jgi:ABC-2 type transport system ATP-binding protein